MMKKIKLKITKIASIAIMIGGTLINATAFVGGSYLAKYSCGDQNNSNEEEKRHDLAVERYQAALKSRLISSQP